MPIKKKSQKKQPPQQQTTSKVPKGHCTETATKGVDNTSLINTLKENNKSLASALDESRKKCSRLQLDCLKYQQERQELVEKMSILKALVMDGIRDEIISQIRIHIQPGLVLLEQIQRDLTLVKQQLHMSLHSTDVPDPLTGSHPNALSPIAEPDTQVHFAPFISVAAVSHDANKITYPRTPYPSVPFKRPQYSSTPNTGTGSSTFSYPCCAIDFKECVSSPANTSTAKECESVVTDDLGMGLVSPTEVHVLEGGSETSPDLPTRKERKADLPAHEQRKAPDLPAHKEKRDRESLKDSTFDELKDHLAKVQTSKRPRRKCAMLSTSYQEPQIRSKLRQGDRFTDTSMVCPLTKIRSKKGGTTNKKSKPRITLRDITNKKC